MRKGRAAGGRSVLGAGSQPQPKMTAETGPYYPFPSEALAHPQNRLQDPVSTPFYHRFIWDISPLRRGSQPAETTLHSPVLNASRPHSQRTQASVFPSWKQAGPMWYIISHPSVWLECIWTNDRFPLFSMGEKTIFYSLRTMPQIT